MPLETVEHNTVLPSPCSPGIESWTSIATTSPFDEISPKVIGDEGILEVSVDEYVEAGDVVEGAPSADEAAADLVGIGEVVRGS